MAHEPGDQAGGFEAAFGGCARRIDDDSEAVDRALSVVTPRATRKQQRRSQEDRSRGSQMVYPAWRDWGPRTSLPGSAPVGLPSS